MKAGDVLDFVGRRIGVAPEEFPDGGFFSGSPDDRVEGILIAWMATCESLRAAARRSRNLVICHEPPFFDEEPQPPAYRWRSPPDEKPYERDDHPNKKRRKIIEEAHLTLLQIHYGLDRLCIYEDFAEATGLGEAVAGVGYEKVFLLPKPMKLRELAEAVARRMEHIPIRIVGDPERRVTRAGNLWGGVTLSSNRYWMRKQIENGAEVIVCGEVNEEAMFFAIEYGVALIVTAHAPSENIGLANFASMLKKSFLEVPIDFFDVGLPFLNLYDLKEEA